MKKKKQQAHEARVASAGQMAAGSRPRVLFAVGDAECVYTEGKIWRLVHRLRNQSSWDIVGVTNDKETAEKGEKLGLPVWHLEISSPGVSEEERLWATDKIIRETADLVIPGSDLPLCKVLALDDFAGSLSLLGAQPSVPLEADLLIVPLMGVDNNTKGGSGLCSWLVSQALEKGIPVVGLEVSPLGNKHTLGHLPANHYAVKSEWSKSFLIRQGIAQPPQISVLKWEEAYLLWSGQDNYVDAYLEKEASAREILHLPPDRFVVVISHHVSFLWEVRKILEALAQVPGPLSVVIRVDSRTVRRQYFEREIVLKAYEKELRALPQVVVDERVGMGLLLQLADLVISPFAGTTTERAALCHKPTIICQAMGQEGWAGESLYWEPHPGNIPGLIQVWRERGLLGRSRLVDLASALLQQTVKAAA
ncbi:MAG: hypothetical protein HYZ72_21095 [Deltaproteobacteria bacterium]|nr:hypothetical protein [Deltaproteobacteria bacterium]